MKVEYYHTGRWIFIITLISMAFGAIWIPWTDYRVLGTYLVISICILIAFLSKESS